MDVAFTVQQEVDKEEKAQKSAQLAQSVARSRVPAESPVRGAGGRH